MSAFVLIPLFLIAIVLGVCVNIMMRNLLHSPPQPKMKPSWTIEVVGATQYNADYYFRNDKRDRIDGETAVRLKRGPEMHPIGTAKVADEDFEDQLQKLIHLAEDRANTLNAVETL